MQRMGGGRVGVFFRKAKMSDIPQIHALINGFAMQGVMLRRPLMLLYETVRDFVVCERDGKIVGTGALHVLWSDLAEIRSLAVLPTEQNKGIGRKLVGFMVSEAKELEISRLFALTYQQRFFENCGFLQVEKESLPQKVWKECIYCDKFNCCDEVAVIRLLNGKIAEKEMEIPLVDIPSWRVR